MKVRVCNADNGGCGFYRILEPARVLKEAGHDIDVDYQAERMDPLISMRGDVVTSVQPPDCDVVVFQRAMTRVAPDIISKIQAHGIAVVVELDDDYWRIDQRSKAFASFDPRKNPIANHAFLTESCRRADIVTVSTPALARTVLPLNPRVRVLRNYVPASYLTLPVDQGDNWDLVEGRMVVGWTGSPDFHANDLHVAGDSIPRAVRNANATFIGLGAEDTALVLGFAPDEALYSPWVSLEHYPKAVKNFDVGLVPLRLCPFNEAKSYLKGLEYASLGVPFVASPTAEYRTLAAWGIGEIAEQKHDWYKKVTRLLTDAEYRENQAVQGRERAKDLTYEKHAWRWWRVWEEAVKVRRGTST